VADPRDDLRRQVLGGPAEGARRLPVALPAHARDARLRQPWFALI
jgi:hypothetical protein